MGSEMCIRDRLGVFGDVVKLNFGENGNVGASSVMTLILMQNRGGEITEIDRQDISLLANKTEGWSLRAQFDIFDAQANDTYAIQIRSTQSNFNLASGEIIASEIGGIRGHDGDKGEAGSATKGDKGAPGTGAKGEPGAFALPASSRFAVSVNPSIIYHAANEQTAFAIVLQLRDPANFGTYQVAQVRIGGFLMDISAMKDTDGSASHDLEFTSSHQSRTILAVATAATMTSIRNNNRTNGMPIIGELHMTQGSATFRHDFELRRVS